MNLLGRFRGNHSTAAVAVAVVVAVAAIVVACARSATAEIIAPYSDVDVVSGSGAQAVDTLEIQADSESSNETQLSEWISEDVYNEAITAAEVGSNLLDLLEAHDLELLTLVVMFIGTYWADDPRDSDLGCSSGMKKEDCYNLPTYWKAQVVTPVHQGVDGSLIQATIFSNEHRNPANPQRVLSFAGAMLWGSGVQKDQTAIPDGACLAAMYQYRDTHAEGPWLHLCSQNGIVVPNVTAWAEQIEALVEETQPTFLTGHKLGCDIALTVGILNPGLPVVCWASPGTLNPAWIDAYPGLAEALDGNTTTIENDSLYVFQRTTDPTSNCILPKPLSGTGVANVCAYDHPNEGTRCQPGIMPFDMDPWSKCTMMTSGALGLGMGMQYIDFERDCMPREDIGIDFRLRDCPYEDYVEEEEKEVQDSTEDQTSDGMASFLPRLSLSVSLLLAAALEFYA
mmetsp:Transcript_20501/g.48114  ORF Transcript_20501/g.48114 Transcript_20501/m.48114 type:complete len:454 (-) Transcript_20501:213-1574(-)|eukprot:CAMPEP_0172384060 /NCGR_PEP_ID=MMETSP1061-20121228/1854_1 /TAXON_ID=37318 /ORGANISM="Pseudo-nitzschia pungens, Strain cf. pungens" /LENGTH=453 /DNA_ID=CAMNT_0013112547 /DNA_START=64 /DNA_END=1425 /DNA_ORIENTATION=+